MERLANIRNIGISAHIDSGKTTLTERILFYAGRIHRIQEIKGKDGGATMDFMELEKERGITITSAATNISWHGAEINIIDTPGHVDFTIEVERSLRVLDGAVLVLCAVGGVQSQSLTVDRQMSRYRVPRIAFVNKMDRIGADPARVVNELETKLGHVAVPLQIPLGVGDEFEGVADLIELKQIRFEGPFGERVIRSEIPPSARDEALRARAGMLDTLSLYDDQLMETLLEDIDPDADMIRQVVRQATLSRDITPVLFGSAYHNKGVQPLIDAVTSYLPSPLDRVAYAADHHNDGAETAITADPDGTLVALVFKLVQEPFGQVTYARIYRGTILKGRYCLNARSGNKQRVMRILKIHADRREEIPQARAGDIVGLMGVDCISGDTLCDTDTRFALEAIQVAEPVISLAVAAETTADRDRMGRGLGRFAKEDPTFHVHHDEKAEQTIISGMGELHLEVYVERLRREYKCNVTVGRPNVEYREAPTVETSFNYKHKKQTGGSGQYAHVIGKLIPLPEDVEEDYVFESTVTGGRIPTDFIPSVDKGFQMARTKGPLAGREIVRIKMLLQDGTAHSVDSSDLAFQVCARAALRKAVLEAQPAILEPIMRIEVEVPTEFQGRITGDLAARRGLIIATQSRPRSIIVTAEVPLAEMFGYATSVRSMSEGKATFTMEFLTYRRAPASVRQALIDEYQKLRTPARD